MKEKALPHPEDFLLGDKVRAREEKSGSRG